MTPTAVTTNDDKLLFEPCVSGEFSLDRSSLFRFIMLRHCFWLLTSTALAGLLLVIAGAAADLRITVVGIMIWCIFIPMLTAWCWFRHALTTVNAINLQKHRLKFIAGGIEMTLSPKTESNDTDKDGDSYPPPVEKVYFYPSGRIKSCEAFGSGFFLNISDDYGKHSGWLYVCRIDGDEFMRNISAICSQGYGQQSRKGITSQV